MRSHDRHHETEASEHKLPPPETAERSPVELAGTIGNSAMQRIAESPALQRSPAAAALAPTIARAGREEDFLGAEAYGGGETLLGGGEGGGGEMLAHESAHVVQQGAAAEDTQRAPREAPITPQPAAEAAPEPEPEAETGGGGGGGELSPYAEKTFSEAELEEM